MLRLPIILSALATLVAGAVLPRATPASYKLKTHVIRGNHTLDGLYSAHIPIHATRAPADHAASQLSLSTLALARTQSRSTRT
jgi:hypothetical protein